MWGQVSTYLASTDASGDGLCELDTPWQGEGAVHLLGRRVELLQEVLLVGGFRPGRPCDPRPSGSHCPIDGSAGVRPPDQPGGPSLARSRTMSITARDFTPVMPGWGPGSRQQKRGPRITQCTPWGRDNNMSYQPKEDGNSAVQAKPTIFLRVGRVMKHTKKRDRVTRVQRTAHIPCRAPPWAGLVPCVCGGPIPLVGGIRWPPNARCRVSLSAGCTEDCVARGRRREALSISKCWLCPGPPPRQEGCPAPQ